MDPSMPAPGMTAAEHTEASLARLELVTRLLTEHPVDGDWDVRDYAIASLMVSELREVVEHYRTTLDHANLRIRSATHTLNAFARTAPASPRTI